MTQRLFFLLIGLLIGLSFVLIISSRDFKAGAHESVALAVLYYKQQAQHYYLKFTGQLPPPLIEKNREEWEQFAMLCDALMLKRRESQKWFEQFVEARTEAISKIKKQASEEEKKRKKDGTAQKENGGKKKLSAKEMFENWRKEFLMVRRLTVISFVDRMKREILPVEARTIGEILMQQFILPDANLRALRLAGLSEQQRDSLQPAAYQLVKSLIAYSPQFPGDDFHEEEKENMERDVRALLTLAEGNLSSKQMKQWSERMSAGNNAVAAFRKKIEGVKKEWETLREQEKNRKAAPPNELTKQQPSEENLVEAQG